MGRRLAGVVAFLAMLGVASARADDSCVRALDRVCDEAQYGGAGFCPANSDSSDCGGGPNLCRFAFDGRCDERRFGGSGACAVGTDTSDCAGARPVGSNSCLWAFNGQCDEAALGGTGMCAPGTDSADCDGGRAGTNRCVLANDGVCDEAALGGGGGCAPGTDGEDCRGVTEPSRLVFMAQARLAALGYDPGGVDGKAGPATRRAIEQFQRDRGLPVTGQVTPGLLAVLEAAAR